MGGAWGSTTAGRGTLAQPLELVPSRAPRNTWQLPAAAIRRGDPAPMTRSPLAVVLNLLLAAPALEPWPVLAQTLIPGGGAAGSDCHGGWLAPGPNPGPATHQPARR